MPTRRRFILAAAALAPVGAIPRVRAEGGLSVAEAHGQAASGELLLVDIRSREEWKRTGLGASALAISMHRPGFVQKLMEAAGRDGNRKIGLICATGSRSRWLKNRLAEFGFTNVADVPEGMLGNAVGRGWIKAGLPIRPYDD